MNFVLLCMLSSEMKNESYIACNDLLQETLYICLKSIAKDSEIRNQSGPAIFRTIIAGK